MTNPPAESGRGLPLSGIWWASFDWARSPFYYVVVMYVFATYFAETVIGDGARGQAIVSATVSIGGVIMALLAPLLGGYMDRGGAKKPVLFILMLVLAASSAGLIFVTPGAVYSVALGMTLMIIAGCMFSVSELFHNALLPAAGNNRQISLISGLGLSMGSLAAVVVLFLVMHLVNAPPFGLEAHDIARASGLICAVWMLVFLIPFWLGMPDHYREGASWKAARRLPESWTPLRSTRQLFRDHPVIMRFLMARMIFMDGLTALFAIGAVYVAGTLGWTQAQTALMGIVATVSAVAGGFLAGFLDRTFGPRNAILIELFTITAIFCFQISISHEALLFGLIHTPPIATGWEIMPRSVDAIYLATIIPLSAFIIAAYSSCRSLLVFLSPPGKLGYFFGIYAMTSTVTVWVGPALVAGVTFATQSQRLGFSSLLVLFAVGSLIMLGVRIPGRPVTA
ncbi:MAG: MFS transporter [Oceanicaulis sp.]|nr:MFS transporter [Oceanicaulis sp.]